MFKIPNFSDKKRINELSSTDYDPLDTSPLDKNKDAYQTGLNIADLVTYFWKLQKKPGKIYISNRRVHHGEIGSLLSVSKLFKKSQPIPAGILSGLGEGLIKDDYADKDEWFTFKIKNEPRPSEIDTMARPTSKKIE